MIRPGQIEGEYHEARYFCLKATKKQENNKLWQKLAPSKKLKPKSNKNKINQEKCFFSHPRNLLPKKLRARRKATIRKKQPLYRWLRLVFSQNAYGFFLHIEFVLSITEFTFKMCNFPLLVGFVIA